MLSLTVNQLEGDLRCVHNHMASKKFDDLEVLISNITKLLAAMRSEVQQGFNANSGRMIHLIAL